MSRMKDVGEVAVQRRFKPYPAYKDSGAEWLGDVPSHWPVDRLKWTVTCCQNGVWGDEPDGLNDIPCVRVADFDRIGLRVNLCEPTVRSIEPRIKWNRILKSGDLLLEKSGGGEKQPVGAVMLFSHSEPAVCSNFIARMPVASGFNSRFLSYIHSAAYAARLNICSIKQNTGIQNLDSEAYLNEQVCFPPLEEQRAIAEFLDRETAKINALVAKNERLIELLREKRTALITRAVTKGLDPNVPMKDSRVEWLGKIPAHWKVAPVYARYEVALGKMLDSKRITGEYLAPYLRNVDVQWDHVNVEDLPQMDYPPGERRRYSLWLDDLLVCEGGEVGRTAVWRGELDECFYQKAIHRVRPLKSSEVPRFFFYVMNSAAKQGIFVAGGNPNTIDHLTAVQLRHHRFPFPPKKEQNEIAEMLDRQSLRVGGLMEKIQEAIDRLKEYRTALISAAVTGKIDVRAA